MTWSIQLPRHTAATIPNGNAQSSAMNIESMARDSVTSALLNSASATGRFSEIEKPRSPLAMSANHRPYWTISGSFSPSSSRSLSTSLGSKDPNSPAVKASATSPGMTRNIRNSSVPSRITVGIRRSARRAMYLCNRGLPPPGQAPLTRLPRYRKDVCGRPERGIPKRTICRRGLPSTRRR